ncbi:phage holin family protein [Aurantimonas sp. VKM B-3413]|uniref:phage holin family protein n=1 Tax=Aurantimonas sp. VKM B-3413 TaxID=2779401 RepID=UPI001E542CF5|nr:phage holin family protein [Aurantimonas sp. VKM B-3413]MCB8840075.1 phage holin family protein [Aurantimonas sp. VKM B-3413]
MAAEPHESRSVPDLLIDLLREIRELVSTESRLVRAEISDKVRQVEMGGGSIAAGAICLLVALITLTGALVSAVAHIGDMGAGWAALIVGVVIALIGVALLAKGRSDLKPGNLMPKRSAHELREDTRLAKEQTR